MTLPRCAGLVTPMSWRTPDPNVPPETEHHLKVELPAGADVVPRTERMLDPLATSAVVLLAVSVQVPVWFARPMGLQPRGDGPAAEP